jgi:general secretion pathway protein D
MEEEAVESVELPPAEIPSASQPRVFLTGPSLVNAGETFSLDVVVDEVKNLYSAPLFVAYDPQRFEFVRAEEGDFLKADGQSTIFTSSANSAQGQLIIGYKQGAGGRGASGAGTLFRLFFEARAAGAGTVRLERLNFRDPAGNRLPVQPAGIAVEVR